MPTDSHREIVDAAMGAAGDAVRSILTRPRDPEAAGPAIDRLDALQQRYFPAFPAIDDPVVFWETLWRARSASLADWLFALGIGHIGQTIAFQIAQSHRDMTDLARARPLRNLLRLFAIQDKAKQLSPRARRNRDRSATEKERLQQEAETLHREAQALGEELLAQGLVRHRRKGQQADASGYVTAGIGPEAARRVLRVGHGTQDARPAKATGHHAARRNHRGRRRLRRRAGRRQGVRPDRQPGRLDPR